MIAVYYIGFKASATSVSYTITPSGTSAGYNVMLGTYGWQNGINCQATCAKVLYQYTILSVATPGLLDCYGSHITALVSAFFVILALLFWAPTKWSSSNRILNNINQYTFPNLKSIENMKLFEKKLESSLNSKNQTHWNCAYHQG